MVAASSDQDEVTLPSFAAAPHPGWCGHPPIAPGSLKLLYNVYPIHDLSSDPNLQQVPVDPDLLELEILEHIHHVGARMPVIKFVQ